MRGWRDTASEKKRQNYGRVLVDIFVCYFCYKARRHGTGNSRPEVDPRLRDRAPCRAKLQSSEVILHHSSGVIHHHMSSFTIFTRSSLCHRNLNKTIIIIILIRTRTTGDQLGRKLHHTKAPTIPRCFNWGQLQSSTVERNTSCRTNPFHIPLVIHHHRRNHHLQKETS